MWIRDQTYLDRYNDVLIGNQRTCDVDSKITLWRHKRLRKASATVKMFNPIWFSYQVSVYVTLNIFPFVFIIYNKCDCPINQCTILKIGS